MSAYSFSVIARSKATKQPMAFLCYQLGCFAFARNDGLNMRGAL